VRHAPVIRPATGGALNLPRRESGSNLAPRHFHGPALVLPCATVRLRRYRVWRSESTVVGGASGHRIPPGRPGHWRSSPAACRRSRPSPRFTPHRFIFDIGLMATTSAIFPTHTAHFAQVGYRSRLSLSPRNWTPAFRPERNPSSTFWLVYGREGERALPSAHEFLLPLHIHLPGASQPTSRAGHRRLRAEPRRDWARR
jgi:hypothetical protein